MKEEANEHYRALLAQLSSIHGAQGGADAASPEAAANVMVHNRALLRNKRLLLAYVCVHPRVSACVETEVHPPRFSRSNARMARIKALRWTVGSGLPAEISASLSASESDFFKAYSRCATLPRLLFLLAPAHTLAPGCWAATRVELA